MVGKWKRGFITSTPAMLSASLEDTFSMSQ
jgi:hypothetical protein